MAERCAPFSIRTSIIRLATLAMASLYLSACGGGDGASGTPAPATADSATPAAATENTTANSVSAAAAAGSGGSGSVAPSTSTTSNTTDPASTPTSVTPTAPPSGTSSSSSPSMSTTDIQTISGMPASTANVGQNFTFRRAASDPRGAKLSVVIENGRVWSHFNKSTGELWGTPTSSDVGNYPDIRILVSNGKSTSMLAPFSLLVPRIVS